MTAVADRLEAIAWETRQFSGGSPVAGAGMSVRAAYQLVLHGRAVLVDVRSAAQRQHEGEVDPTLSPLVVGPDEALGLSWLAAVTRLLVLGPEGYAASLGLPATEVVGGFRAWRAAGLPVAA